MVTRVGTKGQVVIEKAIRDQLGVEPGCLALQRVVGNRVIIHFVPVEHEGSLRGRLAAHGRGAVDPESWPDAVADAWRLSLAEPEDDEYGG